MRHHTVLTIKFPGSEPFLMDNFYDYLDLVCRIYSASTSITRNKQLEILEVKKELFVYPIRSGSKIIGIGADSTDIRNTAKALEKLKATPDISSARDAETIVKRGLIEDYKGKKVDIVLDLKGLSSVIRDIRRPDVIVEIRRIVDNKSTSEINKPEIDIYR